ncbi:MULTISPECIES: hypothetical protein [Enterococcus]|uniref:hypothetical protein n=1 Tax=Enterococcus TaxID=1350 RepID=UPI000774FF64|nr:MULTISPECIES: hypothetical protein [Enterococcus]KXS07775.1 hypothetical protein AUC59_06430 [Enterococcus faecium]MCM6878408.1 hypothetical protein [Enterococcus faecium]STQ48381.1 Uncharacterised protein [Enterococcus durans]
MVAIKLNRKNINHAILKRKEKMYKNTIDYILEQNAIRIVEHKGNKTNFNIAGYKSEREFQEKRITPQATEYNPDIIKKLTRGTAKRRKHNYFLLEKYAKLFLSELDFNDLHEVYWGNYAETKQYSEGLFYAFLEDMKKDSIKRQNISEVLERCSKEELFAKVKEQFTYDFYQFTLGNLRTSSNLQIHHAGIETDEFEPKLKLTNGIIIFDNKLADNLESFTKAKIAPLFVKENMDFLLTIA